MPNRRQKLNITPGHLVCPQCLEVLLREDIEGFGRCPYCEHAFEFDQQIEDFLLSPLVQHWASEQRPQPLPDDLPPPP